MYATRKVWLYLVLTGGLHPVTRATGAMVGCLVADAAATPVQWIYDLNVLKDLLQQRQMVRGLLLVFLAVFHHMQHNQCHPQPLGAVACTAPGHLLTFCRQVGLF